MTDCTNAQIEENRENLIKALESGDYKKGRTLLRTVDDEYCCLGVMCEVIGMKSELNLEETTWMYQGLSSAAPKKVMQEFGLYSEFGDTIDNKESLVNINDENDTFQPVIEALKSGKFWK